jgi:hypothetical protein
MEEEAGSGAARRLLGTGREVSDSPAAPRPEYTPRIVPGVRGRRVWAVGLVVLLWASVGALPLRSGTAHAAPESAAAKAAPESAAAKAAPWPPLRVLFVGNSYTRFNVLPKLVQRLAQSEQLPMQVEVVAKGGLTLRMHWLRHEALEQIQRGGHSHVVLQAHSLDPVDRGAEFESYADRFKRAIDASGARTVLYQTWARRHGAALYRSHPELPSEQHMTERVAAAYARVAGQLDAGLAPVGEAFAEAAQLAPTVELYREDGNHPSFAGSYLASVVLYATLTGHDPRALGYAPWEVPAAVAAPLREAAAVALQRAALRASSQRWVSGETGAP